MSTAFENATHFYHACESARGWDACKEYVAENAVFSAQCQALGELKSVQNYVEWLTGLLNGPLPGSTYELHASAYDETNKKAIFFATFRASHTGEGAPLPPTNKSTASEYVYIFEMDENNQIKQMTKVWNDPWALQELGWM